VAADIPPPNPVGPAKRRRNIIIGIILGGLALFMYVSIIAKTATMGP